MKIALAQLNYTVGNIAHNAQKMLDALQRAESQGADLVVFSELSLTGYPPKDLLTYPSFITQCEQVLQSIASKCNRIACIVGAPTRNQNSSGKYLYNSAVFIAEGKIQHLVHKSLLPDYDVFDESRHFESNQQFSCINFRGKRIAITICEDLWNEGERMLYKHSPMETLVAEQPDLMINIAASPFDYEHTEERWQVLQNNVKKYALPLVYVNQVGANTDLIFDGKSWALDAQGNLLLELASFDEDFGIVDLQKPIRINRNQSESIAEVHQALLLGIKDYFQKSGFQKAVLGLSGGIDSALVCALACEALGAENVVGILLPSQFSSDHSISDAAQLAQNLKCVAHTLPIRAVANAAEEELKPLFGNLPFNVAEENIQARSRGLLLMALSNKFGWVLLNTTNKSEIAVGYGTLYGDMCGGISVLADVYKTQVYQLSEYINRNTTMIPRNTIEKAPSAELRPGQKDTDSLPDYDILDAILHLYLEDRKGYEEIIAQGFDKNTVERVLKLVNNAEYKRFQAAPLLKISPKAFGVGRRFPIVSRFHL